MSSTNPLQLLRSNTAHKRPDPTGLVDGRPAINTNVASPGLFFKDSAGNLVKIGPVHVGPTAPNASPASGGAAGNSVGEQWLDTAGGTYVFKVWDGSAWRSETGTFVDVNGDVMTGALVMDNQQQVRFREVTANGTNYIALQAPASVASDKTITLPDVNGTVVTTGDTGTVTSTMIADATIVDADISASAEIAVSKLANGTARQLLQTDAAGTGVEWTSNVDVPGTLDVTGAATFDSTVAVTGALTKSGSNVVTVGDTGTVTSTMILDGTIVNADVNASAAIAGTKISPDFGSQNVTTTGTNTAASFTPTSSTVPTNGVYLPAANSLAISTGGSGRLFVDASGNVGVGTSTPNTVGYGGTVLGLYGAANNGGNIWLTSEATTAGNRTGRIGFGTEGNTSNKETARIWSLIEGSTAGNIGGNLVFNTKADGAGLTERLRITAAGLVGVGTSTPASLLTSYAGNVSALGAKASTGLLIENNGSVGNISQIGLGYTFSSTNHPIAIAAVTTSGAGSTRADLVFATRDLTTDVAPTERMRIDSSGRVGVGTTSPARTLSVYSTSAIPVDIESSGNDNALRLITAGGSGQICGIQNTSGNLLFNVSGSERGRFDSSGRLGIGTTSPINALTVKTGDDNGIALTRPTNASVAHLLISTTENGADAYTVKYDTSNNNQIFSTYAGGGTGGNITFRTATSGTAIERVRIDSSGRVGIGTTSPGGTLDVGAVAGAVTAGDLTVTTGSTTAKVTIGRLSSTGNDSTSFRIRDRVDRDVLTVDAGNFVYSQSGTERARIDSSGRVGIGTSSPLNALDVAGNISLSSGGSNVIRVLQSVNAAAYTGPGFYSQTSIGYGVASGGTHRWIGGGDGNTELMRLTSTGLGIGTTTVNTTLEVVNSSTPIIRVGDGVRHMELRGGSTGQNAAVGTNYAGGFDIIQNGSAAVTIDTSKRVLVGTSTARSNFFNGNITAACQIEGTGSTSSASRGSLSIVNNNTDANQTSYLILGKSNGSGLGSNTIVTSDTYLGIISFQGADGSEFVDGASIHAQVDGTPGANDLPTRLVFSTTADSGSSPVERLRIGSNGAISLSPSGTTRGVIIGNAFYDPVNAAGIQIANSTGTGRSLSAVNGSGALQDNYMNLGDPATRWGTVYAATGTINTSDADLKQDVEDLDAAELNVATAIKSLIKKFRFIDAVAEKGSDARIHVGVIAQEVEQAFVDEGLDPRRYGLFCEDTLKDGSKRLGIRYDELLAFVVAAL